MDKTKTTIKKLNYYHKQICSIYSDGKLDENDLNSLDSLKKEITDLYSKGKIKNEHYNRLNEEISISYEQIYRKKINSINLLDRVIGKDDLKEIENDITEAYSKGKINKMHYKILKNKIADVIDNKE